MPKVQFVKKMAPLEVPEGAKLMAELLKVGIPVASSCRGDGICAKCRVHVVEGSANLSPVDGAEAITRERLRMGTEFRLSCQARVLGDVTVDTNYW